MDKAVVAESFKNESGLMQIDVLQDILGHVQELYNNGVGTVFDPRNEGKPYKATKALDSPLASL